MGWFQNISYYKDHYRLFYLSLLVLLPGSAPFAMGLKTTGSGHTGGSIISSVYPGNIEFTGYPQLFEVLADENGDTSLSATVISEDVSCFGGNDGSIIITDPQGGSGNYQYSIDGGDTWQDSGIFENLGPGTYDVQIRDADNIDIFVTLEDELEVGVLEDTADPEATCVEDQVKNTGTGECTYTHIGIGWDATATDNCEVASVTYELTGATIGTGASLHGVSFNPGETIVIWTATDASGNTDSCTFTVTVTDNEPPVFLSNPPLQDVTIYVDQSCNYNADPSITGTIASSNVSDNCTAPGDIDISFEDETLPGPCPGTFVITRSWTITDEAGNTSTHEQIITVANIRDPILNRPPDITIECDQDPADLSITGEATGHDACGGPADISYTDSIADRPCPPEYNIYRDWTAVDCNGNTRTRRQIIRVRDNTPPTVEELVTHSVPCPQDIPEPDPTQIVATDNCGPVTIEFLAEIAYGLDIQPGYCPDSLDHVYRVTGICGNYTDIVQRIIVEDDCGCSPCDGDESFHTVDMIGQPTGSMTIENVERHDLCCDATRPRRCASFNVRIDDNAVGVEISVDGATPNPMDWNVDCEDSPLVDGHIICIPSGSFYLFTYCKPGGDSNDFTFKSIPGAVVEREISTRVSCNTEIIVEDNMNEPEWVSIYPGERGEYNHYLSCTDCLDPVFYPDENAPREIHYEVCGDLGETPCTGEENHGCATVVIYVLDEIEVEFNVDPGAFCEDEVPELIPSVYPSGDYFYEWRDGHYDYDNPGPPVSTEPAFIPPSAGEYSLRVVHEDAGILCSEFIYDFFVAPNNTPPVVTAPDPLVLQCNDPNENNQQLIIDWLNRASAEDDHTEEDDLIESNDYTGIEQFCNNVIIVTFYAEDECGNIGSATSTITIIDTIPPITGPDPPGDIVIGPDPETCAVDFEDAGLTPPFFSDYCDDDASLLITSDAPAAFLPGTTTVTWTATDSCGNQANYAHSVTVYAAEPPIVQCPPDQIHYTGEFQCEATVEVNPPDVIDPCPYTMTHNSPFANEGNSPDNASGTYPAGTTTITWTVTGVFDGVTTCTQIITVIDNQNPTISCPPDLVRDADWNEDFASDVELDLPGYSDNCEVESLTWGMTGTTTANSSPNGINLLEMHDFYAGLTTISYTATDPSGNTGTCAFTVTINARPVIGCPDDMTISTDPDLCTAMLDTGVLTPELRSGTEPVEWAWEMTGATEDTGTGIPITPNPYLFNQGITTITWTARNESGAHTCTQTIEVTDDQQPTFKTHGPFEFCVLEIINATYNMMPEPDADVHPGRPDWYIIEAGNTELDISEMEDNCCDPDEMTIHWEIEFDPVTGQPPISGTGQPSEYDPDNTGDPQEILLWGAPNNTAVFHTITYQLVDCNGNISGPVVEEINVLPRPHVIKLIQE